MKRAKVISGLEQLVANPGSVNLFSFVVLVAAALLLLLKRK